MQAGNTGTHLLLSNIIPVNIVAIFNFQGGQKTIDVTLISVQGMGGITPLGLQVGIKPIQVFVC